MSNCLLRSQIVFNRNCIKDEDGSAYVPKKTVVNVQADDAFDPTSVPEPKSGSIPTSHWIPFLYPIIRYSKFPHEELFPNLDEEAVVPVTW